VPPLLPKREREREREKNKTKMKQMKNTELYFYSNIPCSITRTMKKVKREVQP
jgi:hypothetical protein